VARKLGGTVTAGNREQGRSGAVVRLSLPLAAISLEQDAAQDDAHED
jgi:two-component system sensor histidine kinase RegB